MIVDLQVDLETPEGGLVDAAELVAGAKAAGLDAVLLTQADAFGADLGPYREAGEAEGLTIFAGAKVETNQGLILAILPTEAEPMAEGWAERVDDLFDAHAVMDAVEAQGGVTIALRPYDRDVAHPMGDHLFSLQGLAACEVMTGGLSDIANDLALEAASNMEMPCVGTSGSHGVSGLGTVATLLRTAANNETELCEAIRAGDCWPVTFSDAAPKPNPPEEREGRSGRGRGRGRGGRSDGGRSDGGRSDGGGGGGGRRDGGRSEGGRGRGRGGRGRGRGGDGERPGDDRGNRRRGGRGGRSGPKPDDIGNRVSRSKREMPEDAGNRVRPEARERVIADDVGNRLKRGQSSPYRRDPDAQPEFIPNDIDDNIGNR